MLFRAPDIRHHSVVLAAISDMITLERTIVQYSRLSTTRFRKIDYVRSPLSSLGRAHHQHLKLPLHNLQISFQPTARPPFISIYTLKYTSEEGDHSGAPRVIVTPASVGYLSDRHRVVSERSCVKYWSDPLCRKPFRGLAPRRGVVLFRRLFARTVGTDGLIFLLETEVCASGGKVLQTM